MALIVACVLRRQLVNVLSGFWRKDLQISC
jgi:hypothetical protein